MASFLERLWESVFTAGPSPTLLNTANATFAALQVVLAVMLALTSSLHVIILSIISGGLWWSINWFARELRVHQQKEDEKAHKFGSRRAAPTGSADIGTSYMCDSSETEAKVGSRGRGTQAATTAGDIAAATSRDVETTERTARDTAAELKQRAASVVSLGNAASLGTKSSVSTEDEWEKISENEKDK